MNAFSRVVTLAQGVAMVSTDLHGNWHAYETLKHRFLSLYERGLAQYWVLCGDVIHTPSEDMVDSSLAIIHDIMYLQEKMGRTTVILLSGNHEMPHIYGITISKGGREFTQSFEWAMADAELLSETRYTREDVRRFLRGLPFYVCTQAGVMISHAGAPSIVDSEDVLRQVLAFDHEHLLSVAEDILTEHYDLKALKRNKGYLQLSQRYLAVKDAQDPRLPELLRGQVISQTQTKFQLLYETLFLENERGSSIEGYLRVVSRFLSLMNCFSPVPQHVLTAGHVVVRGGYQVMGANKLRFASYAHATPPEQGVYLLLDCAALVTDAGALVPHLHPTFDTL